MSLDLATDYRSAGASVPTAGKGRVCLPRRAVTSTEWVTNSSCTPLRPQQQTPTRQSRVPAALTELNDEKLPVTQANVCSSFRCRLSVPSWKAALTILKKEGHLYTQVTPRASFSS